MKRISKFAKPLGIAMAVVGIAMIAISGYYLFEYARSGSDAATFNVDAAEPEQMRALLGLGLPDPVAQDKPAARVVPAYDSDRKTEYAYPFDFETQSILDQRSDDVDELVATRGEAVELDDRRLVAEIDGAETVSISSRLAGAAFASENEVVESEGAKAKLANAGDEVGVVSTDDVPAAFADRDVAADAVRSDSVAPPTSMSTAGMLDTFASIYPGGDMNPRYWSEPHWAGNLPFGGPTIPEGFVAIDASDLSFASTTGEQAVRMRIPAIDLDASVAELELRDLGDSRAWSTPDKVVGHIPTTAQPGESANGWYFGHLDDFLSNEGAIFRRLPEISAMVKDDYVDIFLETSDAEFMYRVTATRQLHRDELYLAQSDSSQISLVTCWPFRVYDHRIVVSAVLIAVKPLSQA